MGRRMTTNGSFGVSSMSSRMGRPLLTTSRIRLPGITVSHGWPMALAASARPKRRA
ncbi:hypothetical protein D9M71_682280 [compost metagenome]